MHNSSQKAETDSLGEQGGHQGLAKEIAGTVEVKAITPVTVHPQGSLVSYKEMTTLCQPSE